ncbi:MAG: hypothetical protein HON94_12450 [Methylococcales bacterium]|jgi:hypothetical protein|nr:hypothetical protein [Methylococcales bacterium]MBT7410559.1 hypothetical protein [Methylococcales bacterium]
MSEAHIEKFYEMASKDKAMFTEMLKGTSGPDEFITNVVSKAKERGFDFSHKEASGWVMKQQQIKANGELSDAQLEGVAGGKSGNQVIDMINVSAGTELHHVSGDNETLLDNAVEWVEGVVEDNGGIVKVVQTASDWFNSW